MSDSTDRFARLRSLQSGLKTRSAPPSEAEDDLPSLASVLDGEEASVASDAADEESLSAYFEALGLVPSEEGEGATEGATGAPPEPYTPTSAGYGDADTPEPSGPAADTGESRPVDARDLWADPVRENDAYLSSFAGADAPDERETGEPVVEDDEETEPATDDTPPAAPAEEARTPEDESSVTETAEEADTDESPPRQSSTEAVLVMDNASEGSPSPRDTLGFGTDVDIEAFEREIARVEKAKAERAAFGAEDDTQAEPETEPSAETDPSEPPLDEEAVAGLAGDGLSIAFDAGRAATLEQVSQQMGCSVDDVVITAVDWYLDALFGEDGTVSEAGAAE